MLLFLIRIFIFFIIIANSGVPDIITLFLQTLQNIDLFHCLLVLSPVAHLFINLKQSIYLFYNFVGELALKLQRRRTARRQGSADIFPVKYPYRIFALQKFHRVSEKPLKTF